jgi:hypothetical protein
MVMKKYVLSFLTSIVLVGCGGGGGGSTPSVNGVVEAPSTYTFSTDISVTSYPSSYSNISANTLLSASSPCNLDFSNITVPKEWMGNYTLPAINNAPLDKTLYRGVALKDIMLHDNPAFILDRGCTGNLHSEFAKTVNRLKLLGVEQITVPQWHWVSKDSSNNWYITRAEDTYGSLIDSDLTELVKVAHSAGIKVIVMNQVQEMLDNTSSTPYIPKATYANQVKWFDAFKPFMSERASFFQSIGVDMIEVGCGACIFSDVADGSAASVELSLINYLTIIDDVKSRYAGKLFMYISPLLFSETFRNKIDMIALYSNSVQLTTQENNNLSVDSYKTVVKNKIYNSQPMQFWTSLGKPLMVPFDIQSRANALTEPGYVEETGCTAYIGSFDYSSVCIQKQQKPDFSLQAIVFQATLEAINEVKWPAGSMIIAQGYWATDVMTPYTAYPNIASSFRNKPAEHIVKAWFKK